MAFLILKGFLGDLTYLNTYIQTYNTGSYMLEEGKHLNTLQSVLTTEILLAISKKNYFAAKMFASVPSPLFFN